MADKNKSTITSRSAKANVRARTQQRHKNLLGGKGIDPKSSVGTPQPKAPKPKKREKVKTVASQEIKDRAPKKTSSYGPSPGIKADSSGIKNLGVKKAKVSKVNEIKAKGTTSIKPKSSDTKATSAKPKFKQTGKQKRQTRRAERLSKKADAGAKSGSITEKKYNRLNKRAQRSAERASGKRKTVAGTALKALGRAGQSLGHAYGYGTTERLKGDKVSSKKKK